MERARALSTTRVALLVGFLFVLGLAAVALLLLLSASPAGAQTSDTQTESAQSTDAQSSDAQAPEQSAAADETSAPTEPAGADDSAAAPSDEADESNAAPLIELQIGRINLEISAPAVTQPVSAIVEPLVPALPLDSVQVEAPPVRARVSVAPVLERANSAAPLADVVAPAPGLTVLGSDASTNASAPASAGASRGWSSSLLQNTGEFRAVNASPGEGDARAPLSGFPSAVGAFGNSVLGSSTARGDFGQGLLLFGVVAVGVLFGLGRGRRLLVEAFWWLRAPWCLLLERPG
jgi:hypothetical protein